LKAAVHVPRHEPAGLVVGGLVGLSFSDWPGELAAVVFCQGCSWRCRYCHNPHLVPFTRLNAPSWPSVLRWLEGRRGLLDAVVFSGGEATSQHGLAEAMREVRRLGFKVGLHTAGPSAAALAPVLPLVDWVGFDFKAPFDAYAHVTGGGHGTRVRESLRLVRDSRVACEVRTTWHPALLSDADLDTMAESLVLEGWREWVIQRFRPQGCADAELRDTPLGEVPRMDAHHPQLRITLR